MSHLCRRRSTITCPRALITAPHKHPESSSHSAFLPLLFSDFSRLSVARLLLPVPRIFSFLRFAPADRAADCHRLAAGFPSGLLLQSWVLRRRRGRDLCVDFSRSAFPVRRCGPRDTTAHRSGCMRIGWWMVTEIWQESAPGGTPEKERKRMVAGRRGRSRCVFAWRCPHMDRRGSCAR